MSRRYPKKVWVKSSKKTASYAFRQVLHTINSADLEHYIVNHAMHLIDFKKVNGYVQKELMKVHPHLLDHGVSLSCLDGDSWIALIEHDINNKEKFLDNLKIVKDKTTIRTVFNNYVSFLTELTVERVSNCKLSAKELLLLITRILNKNDIEVSTDVKEHLEIAATMEVFSGASTLTKHLSNAINNEN